MHYNYNETILTKLIQIHKKCPLFKNHDFNHALFNQTIKPGFILSFLTEFAKLNV